MRSVDEALEDIGDFGPYQRHLYVLLAFTASFAVMHKWIWSFSGATPPHRCKLPFEVADSNTTVAPAFTLPDLVVNATTDPCNVYFPFHPSPFTMAVGWGQMGRLQLDAPERTHNCSAWIYDSSSRYKSVVSEYEVVCDRHSLQQLGWALHIGGEIAGYVVWGMLADRYGRRKVFFVGVGMQVLAGMVSGMVGRLPLVIAMRAALGITSPAGLIGAILRMEFVGPSMRLVGAVVDRAVTSAALIALCLLAYIFPDWRHLQIIISIPGFLFLSFWWVVPESPRWYLAQKRERDCRQILSEMGSENRREYTLDSYESDEPEKVNLSDANPVNLCCYSNTRYRLVLVSFIWLSNSLAFYSLMAWLPLLGDNIFLRFFFSSLIDLPAYLICLLTLNRFGKRYPLCLVMLLAGAAMATLIAIPENETALVLLVVILAKVCLVAGFTATYAFSMELQSSSLRCAALGIQSSFSATGEFLVPWVFFGSREWEHLPLVLCSCLCGVAGLAALLLPETTGKPMPETLHDMEKNLKDEDDADAVSVSYNRQGSISIVVPPQQQQQQQRGTTTANKPDGDAVDNFLTVPTMDHLS